MLPNELSKANVVAHLEIPLGPNSLSFSYLGVHRTPGILEIWFVPISSCQTQFYRSQCCPLVNGHCVPLTVCSCPMPVFPLSPEVLSQPLCWSIQRPLPIPCSQYTLSYTSKLQLLSVASESQHTVGTARTFSYIRNVFLKI